MRRVLPLAVLATVATAFAATSAPAGRTTETLYYGKTSQGLGVYIPVNGTQIPRDSRAYLVFKLVPTMKGGVEFHPGLLAAMSFRGGKLVFHHLAKLPSGTIEVWFQAALTRGGKAMTGTYRERDVGYSPKPMDSGTIRFSAVAWASRAGYDWAGTTADGKPLRATVGYRMVPGHVVVNGKREQEPEYSIKVLPTSRELTCRTSDGATTKVTATLPALTGKLIGSDDLANSFSTRGGLSGSAVGSTTTDTGSIKASLAVKRLSWQGTGLAATGTLSYQGTVTNELGTATCTGASSSFTLRPR